MIRSDVFIELLIDLVDDTFAPGFDLLVDKLDLAVDGTVLLFFTGLLDDLEIKLVEVGVLSPASSLNLNSAAVFDLKIVELASPLFIGASEPVDLVLVVGDLAQELGVCLLSCQEAVDDVLDVG